MPSGTVASDPFLRRRSDQEPTTTEVDVSVDMSATLGQVLGRYEGEGVWVDETGQTKLDNIEMRIEVRPDGRFNKWFKHDFVKEGIATEQFVVLEPRGAGVLGVSMDVAPITGRGYFTGDALHYELEIPGNRVEVSVLFNESGSVTVVGSSEKNKEGRFIWWRERLAYRGA
jgi:hypothetical protein